MERISKNKNEKEKKNEGGGMRYKYILAGVRVPGASAIGYQRANTHAHVPGSARKVAQAAAAAAAAREKINVTRSGRRKLSRPKIAR